MARDAPPGLSPSTDTFSRGARPWLLTAVPSALRYSMGFRLATRRRAAAGQLRRDERHLSAASLP